MEEVLYVFVVFYRKIKGGEIDTLGLARFQLTAALQLRKKPYMSTT